MAKLVAVKASGRAEALEAQSKNGAKTLAGGSNLPEGTHKFVVAGTKPFGILEVESAASGKWALPIVAGTVTTADGRKETFVLSAEAGAKTLVIPDNFYLEMQPNGQYNIEIGSRKGRKVVTNVTDASGATEADKEDDE